MFADSDEAVEEVIKTRSEMIDDAWNELEHDYSVKLRTALTGKGNALSLQNNIRRVAIISVDAATTGRMGVTFYQDL